MKRRNNSISPVAVAALLVVLAAVAGGERVNKSTSVGSFWSTAKEEGDLLTLKKTEAGADLSDRTIQAEEDERQLDGGFSSLEGMLQWTIGKISLSDFIAVFIFLRFYLFEFKPFSLKFYGGGLA